MVLIGAANRRGVSPAPPFSAHPPNCLPEINPCPTPADTEMLSSRRGLRRQTIVQSLMADVFQGRLRAGEHLVTQELATRFGVSHTPIREALIALAGVGVIDLLPNRGAVVRRVSPKEVREVCQVRRALECEATRSACGRIDLAELHALADDLRRMIARQDAVRRRATSPRPAPWTAGCTT